MNIASIKKSSFLTRADCGKGIIGTIDHVAEENIAKEGAQEELKACVHLREYEKPLTLNSTNAQLIAAIAAQAGVTDPNETDNWPGLKIVLYDDPTISFQGKLVGGIRVRAPRKTQPVTRPVTAVAPSPAPRQTTPPPPPPEPPIPEAETADDQEVPF